MIPRVRRDRALPGSRHRGFARLGAVPTGTFQIEDQLRCGRERVGPLVHRRRTGVISLAGDTHLALRDAGNRVDDTDAGTGIR
jgi:hypothetical protein